MERKVPPAGGLYQPDFATPQQGAMLWVYEGMTQYLGHVLAARSGLKSQAAISRCAGVLCCCA